MPQTAIELGARLGISANAVRVHLDGLRRAGLVDYRVERRGVGKPRHVYSITASAEYFLSAAYAPTLNALLSVAEKQLNGGLRTLLREAGGALCNEMHKPSGASPVKAAANALASLGRPVKITKRGSARVLTTSCCPLGTASRRTSHVCVLVEAMLTAASGLPVSEACVRGDEPRCRFMIGPSTESR